MSTLFDPIQAGDLHLSNRIAMAPLTRNRSPRTVPGELTATYYAQRASAGLLVSEGTPISQQGQGYADVPGLYLPEQLEGWKRVTQAVHARGGKIVAQLWHVGRVSHTSLQPGGAAPVAPSAVTAQSKTYLIDAATGQGGFFPTSAPRALDAEELPGIVQAYANAARNAVQARMMARRAAVVDAYRQIAEQHLHWLHGANPMGLVMLSNMASAGAESSLSEIYHTWFANGTVWDSTRTSARGPAPGYLAGGPNTTYTGSVAGLASQPPQKAYKDWNTGWPENSWEVTEPAIYYQAAYVQLLARLMGTADTQAPTAPSRLTASAITRNSATLSWSAGRDNVGVVGHDLYSGSTLLGGGLLGTSRLITGLSCNTSYTLTLRARDLAGQVSAASTALTLKTAACS